MCVWRVFSIPWLTEGAVVPPAAEAADRNRTVRSVWSERSSSDINSRSNSCICSWNRGSSALHVWCKSHTLMQMHDSGWFTAWINAGWSVSSSCSPSTNDQVRIFLFWGDKFTANAHSHLRHAFIDVQSSQLDFSSMPVDGTLCWLCKCLHLTTFQI